MCEIAAGPPFNEARAAREWRTIVAEPRFVSQTLPIPDSGKILHLPLPFRDGEQGWGEYSKAGRSKMVWTNSI